MRTGSARPRRSMCTWPRCGASWRRIRRRRATSRPCGASAFASRPRRRTRAVSLRTRLLLALAYVLVLAVVSLGVPLALSLRDRVNAEVHSQALSQADVVAASSADLINPARTAELNALVRSGGASVRGRVLIVDARGRVLAELRAVGIARSERAGSGAVGQHPPARIDDQHAPAHRGAARAHQRVQLRRPRRVDPVSY